MNISFAGILTILFLIVIIVGLVFKCIDDSSWSKGILVHDKYGMGTTVRYNYKTREFSIDTWLIPYSELERAKEIALSEKSLFV